VLGGALAGAGAVQNVTRSAIVPNLVAEPGHLKQAIALSYGLYQLTLVIGPGVGGLLISALGLGAAYTVDAVSCLAMVAAALALAPQRPLAAHDALPVRQSVAEGLRFVSGNQALMGSFAVDLVAMTFGMPRALFAVLAVDVYGAGASGTGLLYTAVATGATIAALTTGWLSRARYLGRITAWAVVAWGVAVALSGVAGSLWLAAVLLALAGAADSVSAVCRSAINQLATPDRLRGRMSSVFSLVVTSGPRLGDVESGTVAALAGVRFSVVSGGLACVAGVALVVAAFPAFWRFDSEADARVSAWH
jgi:MFS family permease